MLSKLILFLMIVFTTNIFAQDVLVDKQNNERKIIFNRKEGKKIYYADYDDPDFKQIESKKKDYKKVTLANKQVYWFTMRDDYMRFRWGFDYGLSIPIGDFASLDKNSSNAGLVHTNSFLGMTFTKRIYKFIDLQFLSRAHILSDYSSTSGGVYQNDEWRNFQLGIGPHFTFKLSPRFFCEIPLLYHYSFLDKYYSYSNNINESIDNTAKGKGAGIYFGSLVNMRIGQKLAVGLGINYTYTKYKMNYEVNEIDNLNTTYYQYSMLNRWSYLTSSIKLNIHF